MVKEKPVAFLSVIPHKLALFNPICCTDFEMVHAQDASFLEKAVVSADKTKLFSRTMTCEISQGVYLMRPVLKILKSTKKMKEALLDAMFELHLDRVSYDPKEMSLILSAPVKEVMADAKGRLQPLTFNYSQSCYFQAKAWDEAARKAAGDPVGFFLASGTVVEAEILWKSGKKERPRGAAQVEAGIVGMYYKTARM